MDSALIARAFLRRELQALYGLRTPRAVRVPTTSVAFLAMNALERAIFLLGPELSGDALDAGCGCQPYRSVLQTRCKTIFACDSDPTLAGLDTVCPTDTVPLPSNSLDSVLCTEVLEHVPLPDASFQEFRRLLKNGGRLLLSVPEYWPPHELPHDYYRFPRHGIVALLERHGFKPLRVVPRGGKYAFCGQVAAHAWQRWLSVGPLMALWNAAFLELDKLACSPELSLGWIVLAQKCGD